MTLNGFLQQKLSQVLSRLLHVKLYTEAIIIIDNVSFFFCLTTSHLDVDRDVSTAYCQSSSGDGVDWVWYGIMYGGGLL